MRLIEDKAQQSGKHGMKNSFWKAKGIEVMCFPLPVGDYILVNDKVQDVLDRKAKRGIEVKKMDFIGAYDVCVDSKFSMQEIVGNICGKQHARFRDECILAQNNGIKLYVLIENTDGVKTIEDVFHWQNPRMHRYNKIAYMHNLGKWLNVPLPKAKPTTGDVLAKAMLTMQLKYGVEFMFCRPEESGEKILELLGVNADGK